MYRQYKEEQDSVEFSIQIGAKNVVCFITGEALEKGLGATPLAAKGPRLSSFDSHFDEIETIATNKYRRGQYKSDGTITLTPADLHFHVHSKINPERHVGPLPSAHYKR